jgi:hypothetical protein
LIEKLKKKHNTFYKKRSDFIKNKKKQKVFNELVRKNYKPVRRSMQLDEEELLEKKDNELRKKRSQLMKGGFELYYGEHEKERMKMRDIIKKNKMKRGSGYQKKVSNKMFQIAKKLGKKKTDEKQSSSKGGLEESTEWAEKSMMIKKGNEYLAQMKKKNVNMSRLKILQTKIEKGQATKEEEALFDMVTSS